MMNIKYKTLLLSDSENLSQYFSTLSVNIAVECKKESSVMDALEYLLDTRVDFIIVDAQIGEENFLQFFNFLQEDIETKDLPIILVSDACGDKALANKLEPYNVITILCTENWYLQIEKLLQFLILQKLNISTLENNLMQSENTSTKDQLTGALNRYGCQDTFAKLTSRYKAYDEHFCAIMMDIDHFKSVNDTHGHDIGDEILISFANTIQKCIRQTDTFIRLGGEEFLVFLSNVDIDVAQKSAEKMRLAVESQKHSSKRLDITSSFGVVCYRNNESLDEILKRVDTLLYDAKAGGRNRVVTEQYY